MNRITYQVVFTVGHPRGSCYTLPPLLSLSVSGNTRKKMGALKVLPVRKCASQAVLGRMPPTLHATRRKPRGAWRLVQTMSASSVKTRRAPSRQCRDAREGLWSHDDGHACYRVHPAPRAAAKKNTRMLKYKEYYTIKSRIGNAPT